MDFASYMTVSYMTDRSLYILVWTGTKAFFLMAQKCVFKDKDENSNAFLSKSFTTVRPPSMFIDY